MKNRVENVQGFTLVELMVVLAVISILASIAIPAMGSMIAGNKLNTTQEDLITALNKARTMAISRSTISTITINAATNSIQLSAADNSFSDMIQVHPSVNISTNAATLTFGAQGTTTASAIMLTAKNFASLPVRIINISTTGLINAAH